MPYREIISACIEIHTNHLNAFCGQNVEFCNIVNGFHLRTVHLDIIKVICSPTKYLLTPWSRVLLEKLTGSAASQEIPRIFGTRRFITVLTSARHLSLSWANSIQPHKPLPLPEDPF